MNYKVAFIPDVHFPFHNVEKYNKAINILLQSHKRIPYDEIIILGDWYDFYWLTMHPRLPGHFDVECTLSDEIAIGNRELTRLRELFPDAKITFLEGNHEFRLARYITKKCPELFDFMGLHKLIPFEALKIEVIPWGKNQLYEVGSMFKLNTEVYARHRPYSTGKNAAMATLDAGKVNLIAGDVHRKQYASCKRGNGEELRCWLLGWLGDRNQGAFSYIDNHDNWGHAIGEGFWDGEFRFNFIDL